MSIGNIVCRGGVGPKATIPLFVTHGLGIGTTPVVTKTGGDDAWVYRKNLKKHEEILREREREKLEARLELRRQIEDVIHPPKPVEELSRQEKKEFKRQVAKLPDLRVDLSLLENELKLLAAEIELQRMETRRLREEDDIQAILMALNAPFQIRH